MSIVLSESPLYAALTDLADAYAERAALLDIKRTARQQRLRECWVSLHDDVIKARFEELQDGDILIDAVQIDGLWRDVAGFVMPSLVRVWESECREYLGQMEAAE